MLRKMWLIAVALLAPVTAGNAQTSPQDGGLPAPTMAPPAPPAPPPIVRTVPGPMRVKGEKLYVYSFLDVRAEEMGREVLAQFHRQLVDVLGSEGVKPQLSQFGESAASALFIPKPKIMNGRQVVDQVPVLETIAGNQAAETAFGARYRLLVLPANFELQGAWRYYTIRWVLMDTDSSAILWKGDYKGKHLTMWRVNENAEGRGRKLVGGGLDLMRQGGLL